MHPMHIILAAFGVVLWAYWVHLVNEQIENLQSLAKNDKLTSYEVGLKIPNWKLLRRMSQQRIWVVIALVLAPVLVIVWGLTLIAALFFILLPELVLEMIDDLRWTIKRSSSRS